MQGFSADRASLRPRSPDRRARRDRPGGDPARARRRSRGAARVAGDAAPGARLAAARGARAALRFFPEQSLERIRAGDRADLVERRLQPRGVDHHAQRIESLEVQARIARIGRLRRDRLVSRCCVVQDVPVGRWIGLVMSCGGALLIAGCVGGSDDSSVTSASETQPTGLTAIQSRLGLVAVVSPRGNRDRRAVGLGVEVLRSRTDRFLDKTNVCVRMGGRGTRWAGSLFPLCSEPAWECGLRGSPIAEACDKLGHSPQVHLGLYAHVVLDRSEINYRGMLDADRMARPPVRPRSAVMA